MDGVLSGRDSPKIKIDLSGPVSKKQTLEAIIDTGFTGSISIPLGKALPLGLVLYSTASFTLADGSTDTTLLCLGNATFEGRNKVVVCALSKGSDILLGTEFLALFNAKLTMDYSQKTFSINLIAQLPAPVGTGKPKQATIPTAPTKGDTKLPANPGPDVRTPQPS